MKQSRKIGSDFEMSLSDASDIQTPKRSNRNTLKKSAYVFSDSDTE